MKARRAFTARVRARAASASQAAVSKSLEKTGK
jgi:hypothetical protein